MWKLLLNTTSYRLLCFYYVSAVIPLIIPSYAAICEGITDGFLRP